jgi:predicted transcriptional regulator
MERRLTRAEEQVMHKLWQLQSAPLRTLVEAFEKPRPHQNTVATILKTLHSKGFVLVESVGRNHLYKPAVPLEDYSRQTVKQVVNNYFKGSFGQMVSFFAREKDISLEELEDILNQLKK